MKMSRVGRRGQVTLPIDLRRRFGLKAGDHVVIIVEGKKVILQPLTQSLLDLRGSVPVPGPQGFDAVRKMTTRRARPGN